MGSAGRPDEPLLYLTTIGHRTGRPHRIEIWFAAHGGRPWLCPARECLAGSGHSCTTLAQAPIRQQPDEQGAKPSAYRGSWHDPE